MKTFITSVLCILSSASIALAQYTMFTDPALTAHIATGSHATDRNWATTTNHSTVVEENINNTYSAGTTQDFSSAVSKIATAVTGPNPVTLAQMNSTNSAHLSSGHPVDRNWATTTNHSTVVEENINNTYSAGTTQDVSAAKMLVGTASVAAHPVPLSQMNSSNAADRAYSRDWANVTNHAAVLETSDTTRLKRDGSLSWQGNENGGGGTQQSTNWWKVVTEYLNVQHLMSTGPGVAIKLDNPIDGQDYKITNFNGRADSMYVAGGQTNDGVLRLAQQPNWNGTNTYLARTGSVGGTNSLFWTVNGTNYHLLLE